MAALELPTGAAVDLDRAGVRAQGAVRRPADGFEPFPVGYVDLGDVMVEARLERPRRTWTSASRCDSCPSPCSRRRTTRLLGYAFAPARRRPAMTQVAIAGIGMVPFGRHAPEYSGRDMGVDAALAALADAGLTWQDVDYAVGGSNVSGKPDTMVPRSA